MAVRFEDLNKAQLTVDEIYQGGNKPDLSSEPLHYLFPKLGIAGGFRKVMRNDKKGIAYVVLYTTMSELEWPDYLDCETGIFRYYGDNRTPGKTINNTKLGGNKLLEEVFDKVNRNVDIDSIPPFFVFKRLSSGRDVQFLGLAVPGNPNIPLDHDLIAFWRTINGKRFQNYEAYFTILDTKGECIRREWIESLLNGDDIGEQYIPKAWSKFKKKGRNGINALRAPRIFEIPDKMKQLQCNEFGRNCLQTIREHYKDNPQGFEGCATAIVSMMDGNFCRFELTRPWRDGGRDAIGYYKIDTKNDANYPLKIDCALEAKCYNYHNSVGVHEMSRLISRIRYRQFGIFVTTSYINNQAYKEIVDDGHPILIITASDIASIIERNSIYNINEWLANVDSNTNYNRNMSLH